MLQARHNAEEIYSLHAVLRQPGEYTVAVALSGKPIQNSPFSCLCGKRAKDPLNPEDSMGTAWGLDTFGKGGKHSPHPEDSVPYPLGKEGKDSPQPEDSMAYSLTAASEVPSEYSLVSPRTQPGDTVRGRSPIGSGDRGQRHSPGSPMFKFSPTPLETLKPQQPLAKVLSRRWGNDVVMSSDLLSKPQAPTRGSKPEFSKPKWATRQT